MDNYTIEVNKFHKRLLYIVNNLSSYKIYEYNHAINNNLSIVIKSKDLIIFNCIILKDYKRVFNIVIDVDKNIHSVYDDINDVRLYKFSVSNVDNEVYKIIILSEYIDNDIYHLVKYMTDNIFNDEIKYNIDYIGLCKSIEVSKVIKEFIGFSKVIKEFKR